MLVTALAFAAQQSERKTYRVGLLQPGVPPNPHVDAFLQGLRDHGYVEGQNVVIEGRWAQGASDRLRDLATELVGTKVDVIVTEGTLAAQAVKEATRTIPIVMARSGDAVGSGLVETLARPGGNVTGLSILSPELTAKRLELLKEIIPRLSNVVILSNPANPHTALEFEWAQSAAPSLGIAVQLLGAQDPSLLGSLLASLAQDRTRGLVVLSDALLFSHRTQIADLATKNRIPAVSDRREYAEAGILVSLGPNSDDLYRRAAAYVDKILKGAKPGDLPVEQPTKFELVINLKTGKSLGLTISQSLLLRADEVIQ